jgi:nicotinate-nucleotide pyrophosphorylase (carboxylating)
MNCNSPQLVGLARNALKEDIGKKDITTELVIPEQKRIRAVLLAKEDSLICGLGLVRLVFRLQDKKIKFKPNVREGRWVKKGTIIASVEGRARPILTAERVALNFLSFLSGIATKTGRYCQAVRPYKVKIMDTRKTLPGLRQLEKYAVRVGGGSNHRIALDKMILVKDNHLKVVNGYRGLPRLTRGYRIELEVKNLKEFKEALKLNPDIIMLDNMPIREMKAAIRIKRTTNDERQTVKLEASGGVRLKNVKRIASLGVDIISIGGLTHSIDAVDFSLEVV